MNKIIWNNKKTDTSDLKNGQMALGYYRQGKKLPKKGFALLTWNIKNKAWDIWVRKMLFKIAPPDFWIKIDPPEGA